MIIIENLSVQFGGVKPIDGLSVKMSHQIIGLIGPNGAGKTTLLNVFSGFIKPKQGRVILDGKDITQVVPHKRAKLGLRRTFQMDQIANDLTLWQNVEVVADHAGYSSKGEADKAIQGAIDYVDLGHRIHRKGSDLTTGERHLAEISKALVGQPKLIMLDEPGAGMSETESKHLQQVIRGIPKYCGAQVFLIDHDVELIDACCEQTMVLDFGKLLAYGPTTDVLEDPLVRRAYLGDFEEMQVGHE
ncbi:MAG: ABC transporter ATP-binding protein [Flavobacteriales bacterium]|jgi:branched-chain amino acid transport system ATP-binding protein|nr:ABC transporter ATP-binding protein [Flavobacteriales bacterium]